MGKTYRAEKQHRQSRKNWEEASHGRARPDHDHERTQRRKQLRAVEERWTGHEEDLEDDLLDLD